MICIKSTLYRTKCRGGCFAAMVLSLFLPAGALYAAALPDWFTALRDAVYKQELRADRIAPLYQDAVKEAQTKLGGQDLYLMLSRCEYMMGRAYQYEERKNEAAACYEKGIEWAQKSLDEGASAEGWRMLAENISQSCVVKPASYAMANGLKVERYAKNALAIDPRNAAAQYMIASRWVYAPAPFHNYQRGIKMMEDILRQGEAAMDKDDRFNVYSAIGYAYVQQKKYREARPWLEKSLTVYPTNKFVQDILKTADA